jgi:acetylornithine deacetylase
LIARLTQLSGEAPATAGYGTNCMAYGSLATSTVVFGPGSIDQAHQAVEWVDIAELVRAADIYRQLLTA